MSAVEGVDVQRGVHGPSWEQTWATGPDPLLSDPVFQRSRRPPWGSTASVVPVIASVGRRSLLKRARSPGNPTVHGSPNTASAEETTSADVACPCGNQLSSDACFCTRCGRKRADALRKCPSCGTRPSNDAAFCQKCGLKFPDLHATPQSAKGARRFSLKQLSPPTVPDAAPRAHPRRLEAARAFYDRAFGARCALPTSGASW